MIPRSSVAFPPHLCALSADCSSTKAPSVIYPRQGRRQRLQAIGRLACSTHRGCGRSEAPDRSTRFSCLTNPSGPSHRPAMPATPRASLSCEPSLLHSESEHFRLVRLHEPAPERQAPIFQDDTKPQVAGPLMRPSRRASSTSDRHAACHSTVGWPGPTGQLASAWRQPPAHATIFRCSTPHPQKAESIFSRRKL